MKEPSGQMKGVEPLEAEDYSWDDLTPLHGIIHKDSHKFLKFSNDTTVDHLLPMWKKNIDDNHKNGMWKIHGSLITACSMLGKNKAIIGVGAGRSFKNNADTLKFIHDNDAVKNWEDRDFIIFASNHQFKPLLKMGIIPDFVYLVDASGMPSVHKQLCEGIPREGKDVVLIAPFNVSPNIATPWTKQGRKMLFFVSNQKELLAHACDVIGEDLKDHAIVCGGNVLNTMWMFSSKIFGSTVFLGMGNDLSFPIKKTKKEQEKGYYCDGDYSTNAPVTGSGRDEAACEKKWLGFKIKKRNIFVPNKNNLEIVGADILGTSHSLWVYKTWIEESMLLVTHYYKYLGLHYYNCTEGGILGVMAKSLKDEDLKKNENWYMLDEVCSRWHTTTLEHAATQFLKAKEGAKCQGLEILADVQAVRELVLQN